MKQDLTRYSDQELVLWVMNDWDLYQIRHTEDILGAVHKRFETTPEQVEELLVYINEDREEQEKWA